MKKILFTCFLALLCLYGSPSSAQSKVAESPWPYSLHRIGGLNRGGETLSDIFLSNRSEPSRSTVAEPSRSIGLPFPIDETAASLSGAPRTCPDYFGSDVSGHPASVLSPVEAPSNRHPTPLPSPVSGLPSQNIGDPASVIGHPTPVLSPVEAPSIRHPSPTGEILIYGELINPDSLGVLKFSYSEVFLSQGFTLRDSSIEPDLTHGTFYDGVLDPRVQKFQTRIPVKEGPVLVNLDIGQRSLLKDYLVYPGDSIKFGIDLQDFAVVFSGPQAEWFEAQYAVKRAQSSAKFGSSRVVLEDNREGLLDQTDNRARMEAQDTVFGSRIAIYEFGRDGLDWEQKILLDSVRDNIPGWTALQSFRGGIPQVRFGLLESQLIGAHYASHLAAFRKYHHGMPLALGDSTAALRARAAMPEILGKLDSDLSEVLGKGLSPGALDLAREWSATERVLTGETLEASISARYQSPVRERLLLSVLTKRLQLGGISPAEWETYTASLQGSTVNSGFEALKSNFQPGVSLAPADFFTLAGDRVSLEDFRGRPTLLYFYFSGCTHSGNYFRNYLWPFYQEAGKDTGLQLIAISVDRDPDLWRSQLSEYSSTEITNLNLPMDRSEDWLDRYRISSFPRAMLLDGDGKVLSHSLGGKDYEDYKSQILFLLQTDHPIVNTPSH